MEKNRIDELYAAWMLTEILHEKKLINDATIEAIRQKVKVQANLQTDGHKSHRSKAQGKWCQTN